MCQKSTWAGAKKVIEAAIDYMLCYSRPATGCEDAEVFGTEACRGLPCFDNPTVKECTCPETQEKTNQQNFVCKQEM